MNFNRVQFGGRLTRDPQLRFLPNQSAVCDFGMACNRKFKSSGGEDREEATFVDVTAFGKQAELINQYCRSGSPLFIEARLRYQTWEDKGGGGKRSKLELVVENFQFLGSRQDNGGGEGGDDFNADTRPAPRSDKP